MAGVVDFTIGAAFIIRTYKSLTGDPQDRWSNAYEVIATQAGTLAALKTLASKLINCEKAIHGTAIKFTEYSISTWQPDSHPYDPVNFYVEILDNVTGLRTLDAMEPLQITLLVKRQTAYGRNGKLFFRGALNEDEVESVGHYMKLDPLAPVIALWNNALTTEVMSSYFAGGAGPLHIALLRAAPEPDPAPLYVDVSDLEVAGVVANKMTHRWYNVLRPG